MRLHHDEDVPASLDHVTLAANDLAPSLAFYEAALGALGYVRLVELVDEEEEDPELEAAAWGHPDGSPSFWLVHGPTPTTGLHLCLRADSRGQVETFHDAAVAAGGVARGRPRRWTLYRRGEFNAIVCDPAGNLIEAVSEE